MEVRTTKHIIADLLQRVVDAEWSGDAYVGCHCHSEHKKCCPYCKELENDRAHQQDCGWVKLVSETRAFLSVENKLAEENGEDTVYVP